MKSRRRNASDDGLTISRRNSPSSTSEPIPIDLIFELLLRLPARSIAMCRCVSKLWASILGRPDFTELFFTRSSALPKLLFSCQKDGDLLFFSTPQVQNPGENSSLVASSYHMKFPFVCTSKICGHICGLVCVTHQRVVKGKKETVPVICNPSTGQSIELPKVKTRRVKVRSFFVYDPICKQFKILSMSWSCYSNGWICEGYQVLTLGAGNPSWRMIECGIPHHPAYDGICIDGCLYYQAAVDRGSGVSTIVCFDIRFEKFRLIKKANGAVVWFESTLVNYKGKLGTVTVDLRAEVTGQSRCIELWVLADAEKHEWSKQIYSLPSLWKNVVGEGKLYFVGMTDTNEIVMSRRYASDHFYVSYYNFERGTIRRVEIQGIYPFKHRRLNTFLHHVEDVKLYANVSDFIT